MNTYTRDYTDVCWNHRLQDKTLSLVSVQESMGPNLMPQAVTILKLADGSAANNNSFQLQGFIWSQAEQAGMLREPGEANAPKHSPEPATD